MHSIPRRYVAATATIATGAVAATRLGTPDPRFWLHRAVIEAELGRRTAARRHIARALRSDAGVSPWLTELARHALRS